MKIKTYFCDNQDTKVAGKKAIELAIEYNAKYKSETVTVRWVEPNKALVYGGGNERTEVVII